MRAIIIDDEKYALESFERMLHKYDVTVCAAFQDPRQAVAAAAQMKADAAFIDMEMPGLNGLETAERLLALQPDIQIVFVTAYDQYAVEAFELAAVDYVMKPVQPKRLEQTLARLMRDRRTSEQQTKPADRPTLRFFHELEYMTEDGRRIDMPWRTTKAKEMFAYLLHVGGMTVSKEALIDLLWPEQDEEKALTNLHTTVYLIRRMLKCLSMELPVTLAYGSGGYRLDAAGLATDKEIWEAEIREALADSAQNPLRIVSLLDKCRGDYLEKEGYLWAESERQRLRMIWLEAAMKAVEWTERRGGPADTAPLLVRIRERFPYSEDGYFRLMLLYEQMGLVHEVKTEYERLVRMQEEELGVPVRADIADWYKQWAQRR